MLKTSSGTELFRAWTEVCKKSATTRVLLRVVANHGPVDTATIADTLARNTGWDLAERALYRSIRRRSGLGLMVVDERPGHRTGARRHFYEISDRASATWTPEVIWVTGKLSPDSDQQRRPHSPH